MRTEKVTKVRKDVNLEVKKRSFEKTAQMLTWQNWKESSSAKFLLSILIKSSLKDLEKEIWRMESSGKPGMVHISEKTYSFLEEEYYVQKAEGLEGRDNKS